MMKINVTQADIDAGLLAYAKPGVSRPAVCPICQAIRRVTTATRVEVYPGHENSAPVVNIGNFAFKMPRAAAKWARRFDTDATGEPFSFSLSKLV